jgi:signal transduction histidine kinase
LWAVGGVLLLTLHSTLVVSCVTSRYSKTGLSAGLFMKLQVKDTGTGIPQNIVDRIFDPFFSTKPRERGTGLGLSISYGLVLDHHGQLLVESLPNATTRFIMDLPVENGWSIE